MANSPIIHTRLNTKSARSALCDNIAAMKRQPLTTIANLKPLRTSANFMCIAHLVKSEQSLLDDDRPTRTGDSVPSDQNFASPHLSTERDETRKINVASAHRIKLTHIPPQLIATYFHQPYSPGVNKPMNIDTKATKQRWRNYRAVRLIYWIFFFSFVAVCFTSSLAYILISGVALHLIGLICGLARCPHCNEHVGHFKKTLIGHPWPFGGWCVNCKQRLFCQPRPVI